MPKSTIRALVCGSNYARAYVRALHDMQDRCKLVGVLARGSDRSRTLAEQAGVPLYRSLEDLPDDIQVACVAVPSSETGVICGLLDRGIDVLAEHPVPLHTLECGLARAGKRGRVLHVNGHFSQVGATRAFAQTCREVAREAAPVLVQVTTTDRMLYGALDTLAVALSGLSAGSFTIAAAGCAVSTAQGDLCGIPCVIHAQHAGATGDSALPDGSVDYFVDLSITVTFPIGALTLSSLCGPVIWTWNLFRGTRSGGGLAPRVLFEGSSIPDLANQRLQANKSAVNHLLQALASRDRGQPDSSHDHLDPAHVLAVTRAWETLGSAFAW